MSLIKYVIGAGIFIPTLIRLTSYGKNNYTVTTVGYDVFKPETYERQKKNVEDGRGALFGFIVLRNVQMIKLFMKKDIQMVT